MSQYLQMLVLELAWDSSVVSFSMMLKLRYIQIQIYEVHPKVSLAFDLYFVFF